MYVNQQIPHSSDPSIDDLAARNRRTVISKRGESDQARPKAEEPWQTYSHDHHSSVDASDARIYTRHRAYTDMETLPLSRLWLGVHAALRPDQMQIAASCMTRLPAMQTDAQTDLGTAAGCSSAACPGSCSSACHAPAPRFHVVNF